MSLIIQTPPEIQQAKQSRLRSEVLRMSLAAGALILSFLIVAPVMQLKPSVRATPKKIVVNPNLSPSTVVTTEAKIQANPSSKKVYTINKSMAVEFHHRIDN